MIIIIIIENGYFMIIIHVRGKVYEMYLTE